MFPAKVLVKAPDPADSSNALSPAGVNNRDQILVWAPPPNLSCKSTETPSHFSEFSGVYIPAKFPPVAFPS